MRASSRPNAAGVLGRAVQRVLYMDRTTRNAPNGTLRRALWNLASCTPSLHLMSFSVSFSQLEEVWHLPPCPSWSSFCGACIYEIAPRLSFLDILKRIEIPVPNVRTLSQRYDVGFVKRFTAVTVLQLRIVSKNAGLTKPRLCGSFRTDIMKVSHI